MHGLPTIADTKYLNDLNHDNRSQTMTLTTIEIKHKTKLRLYCLEHNITMKDFVNAAIKEKLERSRR